MSELVIWDGIGHTFLGVIKALLPLLVLFTIIFIVSIVTRLTGVF